MWGWESGRTGKKSNRCCHLDHPLPLPPTPPTLTFPGGRRCPPTTRSTRNTRSLRILWGWLRSAGEADKGKQNVDGMIVIAVVIAVVFINVI